MRTLRFALTLFLSCLVVGCQSAPLVWKNPFARATTPDIESVEARDRTSEAGTEVTETESAVEAHAASIRDESAGDTPPPLVEQLWTQAEQALQAENFAKANTYYREIVSLEPQHAEAHHRLGYLADQQGNFALAERHYLTAIDQEPDNPHFRNDLAMSYFVQERFDESEQLFRQLLRIDPQNQLALENLGRVKAKQGELAEAFDLFRQSGHDHEVAKEMVLSLQPLSASSAGTVASRREPADSGLPYNSPSPDWDSTYGLSRESADSGIVQVGNRTSEANVPAGAPITNADFIDPARDELRGPATGAAPNRPAAHELTEIERAALNSGPGRLFPVRSIPDQFPDYVPQPPPTAAPVLTLEEQLGSAADRDPRSDEPIVRHNSGMSLQSPIRDARQQPSEYAIPVTHDAAPATSRVMDEPATARPRFDQFPTQPGATSGDSLREFEAELQRNPFAQPSTLR